MPQKQSCMKPVRHNVSISTISIALYLSLYNTTVRLHFLQLHKATFLAPQGWTGWPLAKTPLSLLSHMRLLWCFEREMTLGNNSDPQSPDGPKSSLLSTLLWGHPDVPQLSHRKPNSCGCGCNHNHLRTCQIEVKVLLYCEGNWQFLSKWYIQDVQWNWDKKTTLDWNLKLLRKKCPETYDIRGNTLRDLSRASAKS